MKTMGLKSKGSSTESEKDTLYAQLKRSEELNKSLFEGSISCVKILDTKGNLLRLKVIDTLSPVHYRLATQ